MGSTLRSTVLIVAVALVAAISVGSVAVAAHPASSDDALAKLGRERLKAFQGKTKTDGEATTSQPTSATDTSSASTAVSTSEDTSIATDAQTGADAEVVPAAESAATTGSDTEIESTAETKAEAEAGQQEIQLVCSEAQSSFPFNAKVTKNFVLLYCGSGQWADSTAKHLERTYQRFYSLFNDAGFSLRPLQERLTWICFGNTDDYYRYAWQTERRDVSALEGYYSAQTNRVALYETSPEPSAQPMPTPGAVLTASANEPLGAAPALLDAARSTHEAAHQLAFNTCLQVRGVMYPFWLSEGLATAFESDPEDPSSALEIKSRMRRLLDARAVNTLIPTAEFSIMTRIPMNDMGAVYDAYAQAWGFYCFMFDTHRSQLNHYVARLQSVAPGRRSPERMRREFMDSFGPMKPLEKQWIQYLEGLERLSVKADIPHSTAGEGPTR